MKLVAWNLNHRSKAKKIDPRIVDFVKGYRPDVLILNEFVDSPLRSKFKEQLAGLGLGHTAVSRKFPRQNQIFICSNSRLESGTLPTIDIHEAAEANFLHVAVPERGIEIVGVRTPWFTTEELWPRYWQQLSQRVEATAGSNAVFIGDLNFDPFAGFLRHVPSVSFGGAGQFTIPNPEGAWSFISTTGLKSSRIDHAVVSNSLSVVSARYIAEWEGIVLAGPKSSDPISDHAALSLEVAS